MALFRSKKADAPAEVPTPPERENSGGFFALTEMISGYIDGEFLKIVDSVKPELYWDAAYTRDDIDYYYRFFITDSGKIVRVNASKLSQFLSDFSTLAIAFPSDRCSTNIFSWFDGSGQSEFEMLRTVIPYKLDTCEFSSVRVRSLGGYITSMVSSFADVVRQSFENAMSLFFAQGGAVVSVYDRVFPLTAFVAASVEIPEKKTVMALERKGENYFVWNITNLEGRIIPVNSNSFRISEINPENDIFRACAFLTSETIKIHKFPPAEKLVFIDAYSSETDMQRPRAIQSVKDSVSSIGEVVVLETPDAALIGMTKGV